MSNLLKRALVGVWTLHISLCLRAIKWFELKNSGYAELQIYRSPDVSKECRISVTLLQNAWTHKTGIPNTKALETSNLTKCQSETQNNNHQNMKQNIKMNFKIPVLQMTQKLAYVWYPSIQGAVIYTTRSQKSIFGKRWYSHSSRYSQLPIFPPVFIRYKTMPNITKRFIRRGVWSWVDFEGKLYKRARLI